MDACDPDAEIADLRKLIKMNTGESIKLTREQICQVYDDIQEGKLPLPPLVFNSRMGYLYDKKSPLTPKDFDVLFSSASKRTDLKKIARKVGLKQTDQMTKNQIFDSIGKRLRYMNVHEPIKISKRRVMVSKTNTAVNNTTAVNNLGLNNTTAVNSVVGNSNGNRNLNNITGGNINRKFNNNSAFGGSPGNRNANVSNKRNFNNNSAFGGSPRNLNTNNNVSSKRNSEISFPKKSLFATMNRPDFTNGKTNNKPSSIFGGLFGGSKNKNNSFVESNTFNGKRNGYVFKTGNKGTGYYKNEGSTVPFPGGQGPLPKPANSNKPVTPVAPNKPKNNKPNNKVNNTVNNKPNKVNTGVGNNKVNNKVNTGVGNNKVNNKPNKVNTGVGNNKVNNKPNKVNTGVGNNKVNNNKPNKVNTGVGNNKVNNNKNNNGNTIMTNANANNNKVNANGNTIMTNANANNNNKPNKVNTGVGNNTVNNNKNNNGNTIMTNAGLNTINEEPNKENAAVNNQARRNEENRKEAEKVKKREEIEAKREAAREEVVRRQEELKKKREESKRIANIEKNLLSLPNVDKVYLTAFKGNKSVENVNKNALANKVKKDVVIRNLRNQLSPLFMGKRRVAYVNPTNYNSTKANIEKQITEKVAKKADLDALKKLSVNAAVSTNYVKAFANGKSFVNVSLNALKSKRNKDLEVYKLDATDKKGMFGGYSTTVPGTKTMKFIPNAEYNKSLNRAKNALQARRNAKQLAENKRKPIPANNTNTVKPNNNGNNVKPNNNTNTAKPSNNGNNVKPNTNTNTVKPSNNGNNVKPSNNGNNVKPNNNFNAAAELNKQLENEAKRQNRAKNNNTNNNFNAAAELNKQLNNEAKRQNNNKKRANRATKGNNANNNFNAAAELNKQLNNEGTRQLENKRKQVRNKTSKHVAGIFGRIGKWNKPIKNAKTFNNLNVINKNINKRVELKGKIEASNIPSKRELLDKLKKFNMNVNDLNKIFKKELNNNEFNAGAELNKQLNIEGNRQLKNKKNTLIKKTKNTIANPFRRIGRWNTAIKNAKTLKELNNLNKNLNNRIKLRNEIKKSVLTRDEQSEYAKLVMKFNQKTANTRKRFENGVNKKISNTTGPLVKGILNKAVKNNNNRGSFNGGLRLGNNIYPNSNSNNNTNKPNMKPNPTFEPNMTNNPTFEKLTNENKKPLISAINSLKKLPQNKKTMFKGQLNRAFKNQNLNKMKAIRNEAVAANKEVLAEEKRLKEAKRKEEAEKAAAKKVEREAKKKANALKAVENAANAYVAARKPKPSFKALVQKNKERRVVNAVKTAAQKTALSQATGAERVQLAKKLAPRTQANVKKSNNASKIFKTNVRKAAEGAAESAKEKLRKNAEKKATMMNKSGYQAKINSRNFKIPKNRKKIFTSRIQRATTLGQVLKAYENAQKELPK
jgi:hypothetical protein